MRRSWVRHGMAMIRGAWLVTEGRRYLFSGETDTEQRGVWGFLASHQTRVLEYIACIFRTWPASYRLCLLPSGKQQSPKSARTVTTSWLDASSTAVATRMILQAHVITHFGLSPKVGLGSGCWCHPSGRSSSRGRIAAVKTPPVVATLCDPSNDWSLSQSVFLCVASCC